MNSPSSSTADSSQGNRQAQPAPSVSRWRHFLYSPTPVTPLVYMRIGLGALLCWEVAKYFNRGWIGQYFINPPVHYTFSCFQWIQPWPGSGMYLHFGVLGISALFITLGLFYRTSAFVFCLGFTYVLLLEKARYLNHFYLICLITFLMALTPANRAFSLDVVLKRVRPDRFVPAWSFWLLRLQIGIVYFYAGIAKLNSDWFQGEPLRGVLQNAATKLSYPPLGDELVISLFSYAGLFYDLLVFPLLLHRKGRWLALLASIIFHVTNSQLFNIGIFPWMMLFITYVLFFDDLLPFARLITGSDSSQEKPRTVALCENTRPRLVSSFLVTYLLVQLLVPLRHHLYEGDAGWTFDGQKFAWRMMLHSKFAVSFRMPCSFTDKGKRVRSEVRFPPDQKIWRRHWHFFPLGRDPDMILQCVHRKAAELRKHGYEDIDIRAIVSVSLNGRAPQLIIDPNVNLAEEKRHMLRSYDWVIPLHTPLRSPSDPYIEL